MNIKKILISGALLSLLNIGIADAKEISLGKEVTIKEKTNVSLLLSQPENFLNKEVMIEGKVDVCTERGCWMKFSLVIKRNKIFA